MFEIETKKEITKRLDKDIHDLVQSGKTEGYMDALIKYADEHDVDVEDFVKFLSKNLKDRIEYEAMNNNMLPKKNELPFV